MFFCHQLSITARDSGTSSRKADVVMTVSVQRNSAPAFMGGNFYSKQVSKESEPGVVLFTIAAIDVDSPVCAMDKVAGKVYRVDMCYVDVWMTCVRNA